MTTKQAEFIQLIKNFEQSDLVDLITDLVNEGEISEEVCERIHKRCTS